MWWSKCDDENKYILNLLLQYQTYYNEVNGMWCNGVLSDYFIIQFLKYHCYLGCTKYVKTSTLSKYIQHTFIEEQTQWSGTVIYQLYLPQFCLSNIKPASADTPKQTVILFQLNAHVMNGFLGRPIFNLQKCTKCIIITRKQWVSGQKGERKNP